jgi:hypothetical protein
MSNNSGFKAIAPVAVRLEFIWSIFRNNSVSELAQRLWFFSQRSAATFQSGELDSKSKYGYRIDPAYLISCVFAQCCPKRGTG